MNHEDIESRIHTDEPHQHSALKLESLSISHLETTYNRKQLFRVLKERRDHNVGLKEFVVRSCPTDEDGDELKFGELAEEVKWDGATLGDSDDEGADDGSDSEGNYGFDDDVDVCEEYHGYTLDSR